MVTVADDGGSSGRLRRELGLLPPGDLRMALAALAGEDDADTLWRTVFQHRFGGTGALAGHAVGNLLLAGLLEVMPATRSPRSTRPRRLLGVRGRVLPMCTEPLDIEADVVGLDEDAAAVRRIRGQVAVASTPGQVRRIRLHTAGMPDRADGVPGGRRGGARRGRGAARARARGSPACCRTCWCPSCARR